jgi:hypothetical protein
MGAFILYISLYMKRAVLDSTARFRPARWIGPAGHWICLKGKAPAG